MKMRKAKGCGFSIEERGKDESQVCTVFLKLSVAYASL
jgi:hypothetical protein